MPDQHTVLPFVKDNSFEAVLADLNEALLASEIKYVSRFDQPVRPLILIAGTQRAGTTLLMQSLITSFKIGYISNLVARFWQAPYIGALLANELRQKQRPQPPDFTSELGTTYGYDGPHEFGYFWQHWFPYNETHQTSGEALRTMNTRLLRQELAAVESVFDCPLTFKNPIVFSLNMTALSSILPTAVFVVCRRQPLYVIQSTLLSRIRYHGQKDKWFSIKPREYTWLKDLPYPDQLAGQAFYTEQRITESLDEIDPMRYVVVEYENLCAAPEAELERIRCLVADAGRELAHTGYKPRPFQCTNVQKVDDEEFERLAAACERFYGKRC